MSQAPNDQCVSLRTELTHSKERLSIPIPIGLLPVNVPNSSTPKRYFDLKATRITEESDVPPVEPTITIKEGIFAIKGDISFIAGLPKSGKSTTCRYILATALMEIIPDDVDTLGIRANYCEGRPIIYIDTEQPKAYTKRMAKEIRRIANMDRLPDNVYLYNWRHHTVQENRQAIEQLMTELPDAAYWVIDGITDFVGGANDEKEGNEIIRFFMGAASQLNTTIVLMIHENAGGGKMRGHIGSEAERKCGGAITIQKDRTNGVHWIRPKLIRGSNDFEDYAFNYDKERRRFVLCDDKQTKILRTMQDKRVSRLAEFHRLAGLIFIDVDRMPKDEILKRLRVVVQRKPEQADEAHRRAVLRMFNEMCVEYNVLTPIGEKKDVFRYLAPIETTLY